MPKVSEEYKQEMRRSILVCLEDVCRGKPAYEVTMRDVVRASGMSPGAVYSYFADINALWIGYFDMSIPQHAGGALIAALHRAAGESADAYLDRAMQFIGRITADVDIARAKIFYELEVKRATDPEYAQRRREETHFIKAYKDVLAQIAAALSEASGLPADICCLLIKSYIEGMLKNLVETRCYGLTGVSDDVERQAEYLKEIVRRMKDVQK